MSQQLDTNRKILELHSKYVGMAMTSKDLLELIKQAVQIGSFPLEWANEEGAKVFWTDYPIADTGDWSTVWTCETEDRKGYGHSFSESIEDAMKEIADPTKWDHIPEHKEEMK